jgi:TRAP-type C4-dicarboxylate transport system permease small subunit
MDRLGRRLHLALQIVGVAVVAAVVVATGLGAIGRYLGLSGLTWSFELVGMLFLWSTVIGAILAEIVGENVSIDGNTITSARGPLFRTWHNLILLAVGAALLWSGIAMLARSGFVPTPVMRAPSWVVHSTIAVLGAGLDAIAIIRLVRTFR